MNASSVISMFGGIRPMAKLLGYRPTTVQSWKDRNSIPSKHMHTILETGKKNGIAIKPEFLIAKPKKPKKKNGHD